MTRQYEPVAKQQTDRATYSHSTDQTGKLFNHIRDKHIRISKEEKSCATIHKDIRWRLTKPQLKQNLIAFNGPILPVIKLMYFLFLTGAIWHLYNNNIIPVLVRNKENKILLAPKTSQLNVIAGSVKETLRNKPTRNRMKIYNYNKQR